MAASSVTMPPLPMCSRPTSNCGLIRITASALGAISASGASSTFSTETKLTSETRRSIGSGIERSVEVAAVHPFEADHPGVVAEALVQLVVADIDGVDPRRAAFQQHLGEAAGRGAEVEAGHPRRLDAAGLETRNELESGARDIAGGGIIERYDVAVAHLLVGLCCDGAVDPAPCRAAPRRGRGPGWPVGRAPRARCRAAGGRPITAGRAARCRPAGCRAA